MFKQILKLCESNGFLRKKKHAVDLTKAFRVGPIGSLLLGNLKTEWLNSMLNNKDYSIFYNPGNFPDSYDYIQEFCSKRLPFGIADIIQVRTIENSELNNVNEKEEKVLDFFEYFNDYNYLKCTIFVAPEERMNLFYNWQRSRRKWWRKFSPTPGRYFTTDQTNDSDGIQKVEVRAKYPWGEQLVESLALSSEDHPLLSKTQLQNKYGRRKVDAHYLTCIIPLSTMYMNTICDAYEELEFQDTKRQLFRFHRKLAPYKVSFSIPNSTTSKSLEDLRDLATYLCKKLRNENISTLLIPNSSRITCKEQFKIYDEMGVPYTVVLGEGTLKNGIIELRSRDTTLKEQIHIAELPKYIEILCKNY